MLCAAVDYAGTEEGGETDCWIRAGEEGVMPGSAASWTWCCIRCCLWKWNGRAGIVVAIADCGSGVLEVFAFLGREIWVSIWRCWRCRCERIGIWSYMDGYRSRGLSSRVFLQSRLNRVLYIVGLAEPTHLHETSFIL